MNSHASDQDADGGWVAVARLAAPRGNRGELIAIALTDHPERFERLTTVHIAGSPYEVERVWYHNDRPIFKFRGIDSIGDAEPMAGADVMVPWIERFPLPDGEYYFGDLVGCRMLDLNSGREAGVVTGWRETGGPVLLEVDHGRVLVPFAKAVLPEIDLEVREIRARLPEGLLELNG